MLAALASSDWSHWLFAGLLVFIVVVLALLARHERRDPPLRKDGRRPAVSEPRSTVRIVDPSTPLSRRRPRIFDDDEWPR